MFSVFAAVQHSITPNLNTYQMKLGKGAWQNVQKQVTIQLQGDTTEIAFRSLNLADVTGPEHIVLIAK